MSRSQTTPVSQSGTFGGASGPSSSVAVASVSSGSCLPTSAPHLTGGMANSPVATAPAHHPSSLSMPRTPSGPRSLTAANIPGSQLTSPLTVIPHRHHGLAAAAHSAGGSTAPTSAPWTEETVERQLRERGGDFRLNAELFARLKETANLHPGAIPTSTSAVPLHQLHQNEHAALTAALLNQNINPGALTPGALSHAAAAAGANTSSLDPALIMRHLQEEQRIQDHLATQARIAHHLNSAAAVAAASQQPPPQQQQQHHQHSHLHLHMHQQMAVAQAAAAQAALGLPPFPGLSSSNSAAAMAAAAAATGLNPAGAAPNPAGAAGAIATSAASSVSGEHHAHLAAMLGLPPFAGAANYNNPSNNILSAMGAAAAAAQSSPAAGNSNNPLALGLPHALATRERELQAQAVALAGLIPGGAAGAGGGAAAGANLLSNYPAAAAAALSGAGRAPVAAGSLPEDYLSVLASNHSQFNAQMAQEHEIRRLIVLEQERRATLALNASNVSSSSMSPAAAHVSASTPSHHHNL